MPPGRGTGLGTTTSLEVAITAAAALLVDARDVTLLAHVNPDADSLGSALALGIALRRRGATVRVSFGYARAVPETLAPAGRPRAGGRTGQVPAAPELLVLCDAAEPSRLGALADRLDSAEASLMIDHHTTNPGYGGVQVLDPDAEATVVLVHRVLVAMGEPIDADIARCLYAGLVTDTRGFRTAGEAAHRIAADLLAAGVEAEAVVRPIMDTHPYGWLATLGGVLQRVELEPEAGDGLGLVHASVPLEDVSRFRPEEVDSIVDVLRTVAEAEVAAVLKQVGQRRWVTSLRSKGRVDVAKVAALLGGGGHRAAAGFTHDGTKGEVLAALRSALRALDAVERPA